MARKIAEKCRCKIINGAIASPCLMHVRWFRQRMQPARRLLSEAVPNDKTDPHDWAARRAEQMKIIDATE